MFKKLFNLLFRRKPKHPAIVRKLPNGVIVAAHTEEEADRYEAAALKLNLRPGQKTAFGELEALRLNRLENALRTVGKSAPPVPARGPKIPAKVQHVRIDTYNHPAIEEKHDES